MQCNAACSRATICGVLEWLAPPTLLGRELQHAQRPRMRLQQYRTVRGRILLDRSGEFIDEALYEECLM